MTGSNWLVVDGAEPSLVNSCDIARVGLLADASALARGTNGGDDQPGYLEGSGVRRLCVGKTGQFAKRL
jgi:hypothetical protein